MVMRRKVKLEDLVPGVVIYSADDCKLIIESVDIVVNKIRYLNGDFDFISRILDRYEIANESSFDDVKDLVYKAFKDKVVTDLAMTDSKISFKDLDWVQHEIHDNGNPEHVIKYVKSLYKDKFVIESEEDYRKIKDGASVTLPNGSKLTKLRENLSAYIDLHGTVVKLSYCVLKGATIVQERD